MARWTMLGAIAAAVALSACAHKDAPIDLADHTTRGVYDADLASTEANFDDDLKGQITRAQLGDLSDKMHALGGYKGLKAGAAQPERGRYDFEADFDRGVMVVEMRLDPAGKIAAYRVAPAQAQ